MKIICPEAFQNFKGRPRISENSSNSWQGLTELHVQNLVPNT